MNENVFKEELKKIGIEITNYQLEQLNIYKNYLIEYNSHTNLTAIKDEKDIYLKHFYDSLTIIKSYNFTDEKVLDIGTGAGFPGMVLKIIYPNINITLLDSNNKKITFLKELSNKLNISDINFICDRAEEYCKKVREKYDIVTSRAVSNLCVLSELSLPFIKVGGYFIPLKGSNKDEIEEARYAIKKLGGNIEKIINFTLPIENSERNILLIKKINKTDNMYPRLYSKIIKNPLKKEVK